MRLPDWVMTFIANLPSSYTGQIQINCYLGGVGDVKLAPEKITEQNFTAINLSKTEGTSTKK